MRAALAGVALLLAACGSSSGGNGGGAGAARQGDPLDAVNVFVGTQAAFADFGTGGGAGNTHPAAMLPFGMIQFGPDTAPSTDNFAGGYSYEDAQIRGFSLTHMSGAGCVTYQDLPLMPVAGAVTGSPVTPLTAGFKGQYLAAFSHAQEAARPGSYRVRLNPDGDTPIDVALAAAARAGIAQFGFHNTPQGSLLVNAGGSAMANGAGAVSIDPAAQRITGSTSSGQFCYSRTSYTLYYAIEFDHPFSAVGTWTRGVFSAGSTSASDVSPLALNYSPIPGGPASLPGNPSSTAQAGAVLTFDTSDQSDVKLRVGISYVSADAALANLRAEIPGWDLAAVQQAAEARWREALTRAAVEGGSAKDRRVFYSLLYRALAAPNLFSDADGRYLGMDGAVKTATRPRYHNFSGWDVYRTQFPLLALLFPEQAADFAGALLAQAQENGGVLPKWSFTNQNTETMVGDPAAVIFADARAFALPGFDADAALDAALAGARSAGTGLLYVERPGALAYRALGYVPYELNTPSPIAPVFAPETVWGSVSTTLEYAVADFAIGRLAHALNRDAEAADVAARAESWRNLLDNSDGLLKPKLAAGVFVPNEAADSTDGCVEGSLGQYSWAVPQNLGGLIAARGGGAAVAPRLDDFFGNLNAGPASAQAFLGNEPTLGTPWIYAWLGQPAKTADVVNAALDTLYSDAADGMPGNDDLGTMSSWWVLAAAGIYPAIPGTDVLLLNPPRFDALTLALPGGALRVEKSGRGAYVQSVTLNGAPLTRAWLLAAQLAGGGTLRYRMGEAPGAWGTDAADAPPSSP